jgi:hypothetical protein
VGGRRGCGDGMMARGRGRDVLDDRDGRTDAQGDVAKWQIITITLN